MTTIQWPENKAIDVAIRKILFDPSKYIGARFAPVKDFMSHVIEYDEIHGPQGMTNLHTMDSDASIVKYPGVVRKTFSPGYFKEKHRIRESDLLRLKALGQSEYQRAQAQQIIGEGLFNLNARLENRLEWLRWEAIRTGRIVIHNDNISINAEYGVPRDNLNMGVPIVWTATDTAQGVNDFVDFQQSFIGSGYNLKFVIMNTFTAGLFIKLKDTKSNYAGYSIKEKLTPGVLSQYGPLFIPGTEWVLYDGGYELETSDGSVGAFQKYIPDYHIIGLGDAPEGEIIDIVSVPSLHSPSGDPTPGKFAFIVDQTGQKTDNPRVDVVAGMYCLPRIRRPEGIRVMKVNLLKAA